MHLSESKINFLALLPRWQVLGICTPVTAATAVLIRTCSAPCPDCPAQLAFGPGLCFPPSAPLPVLPSPGHMSSPAAQPRSMPGGRVVESSVLVFSCPLLEHCLQLAWNWVPVVSSQYRDLLSAPGPAQPCLLASAPAHEAGICPSARTQGAVSSSPFLLPVHRPHCVQGFQGAGDPVPTHLVPRIGSTVLSQCS